MRKLPLPNPSVPGSNESRVQRFAAQLSGARRLLGGTTKIDPIAPPAVPSAPHATRSTIGHDLRKQFNDQRSRPVVLVGLDGIVAELALDELDDVIALTGRIKEFEKRITDLVEKVAPTLLALPGCGALTAAKLVGESAGITRFGDEAKFARHAGVAPIPVWSGNTAGRVRMTRSGNRQLNTALHRIAVTQVRMDGCLGKVYYEEEGRGHVQDLTSRIHAGIVCGCVDHGERCSHLR